MLEATNANTPSIRLRLAIGGGLALWFAAAAGLGLTGILAVGPDSPFRLVLLTVVVPIAVFLGLVALAPSVRRFVLGLDLARLTMFQAWRVVGFAFIALYAFDALPGLFAWPAGLGDIAVGLSAPLVLAALLRDRTFVRSRRFVMFHIAGLLDFVVAALTATLASGQVPGLVGEITSAPMEVWPLNLFPSFFVPVFAILHIAALLQVRALRRAGAHDNRSSPSALASTVS